MRILWKKNHHQSSLWLNIHISTKAVILLLVIIPISVILYQISAKLWSPKLLLIIEANGWYSYQCFGTAHVIQLYRPVIKVCCINENMYFNIALIMSRLLHHCDMDNCIYCRQSIPWTTSLKTWNLKIAQPWFNLSVWVLAI